MNNEKRYFKKKGFTLIEAMIVIAVIVIATASLLVFYKHVSRMNIAHAEAAHVLDISNRMQKSYVSLANFNGINNKQAIKDGVIPSTIPFNPSTYDIYNQTEGNIYIGSTNKDTSGASEGNYRSFFITYNNVPSNICSRLVTFASEPGKYTVYVSSNNNAQKPVGLKINGQDNNIDKSKLSDACNNQGKRVAVSFVFERQSRGDITTLNPCVVPSPQFRETACNSGWEGKYKERRTASCDSNYALPKWGNWKIFPIGSDPYTDGSCKHVCVVDPSSPETRTSTPCPPDHSGVITEQRESICSGHIGYSHWGAWEVIHNTCAPNCHEKSPETRYYPVSDGGNGKGCPKDYVGERKQQRTSSCPNTTGEPVWNSWTDTVNTCEKKCIVPTNNPIYQWVDGSGECGPGYSGTETWKAEEKNTASCPSITGTLEWTGWVPTGNKKDNNRDNCKKLCHPDTPLERWDSRTGVCQAGYTGNKKWDVKQKRTSVCAPGASEPNTSAWQDTNETRNMEDNCKPNPCHISASTSRSWTNGGNSCGANFTKSYNIESGQSITLHDNGEPVTGSATFQCNAGSLSTTPISSSCSVSSCTVGSKKAFSWKQGEATCNANSPSGNTYVKIGGSLHLNDSGEPTTGNASFLCQSNHSIRTTPNAGFTCNGTCGPMPKSTTRDYAGCGSGKYGYWKQTKEFGNKPYPTCWDNGTYTPSSAPSGACHSCPANYTETGTRWKYYSTKYHCSSGQYGYITYDFTEERKRTMKYSCPAGTKTKPTSATPGKWSAYKKTSTKRLHTSTCKSCPKNSVSSKYSDEGYYYGNTMVTSLSAAKSSATAVCGSLPWVPASFNGIYHQSYDKNLVYNKKNSKMRLIPMRQMSFPIYKRMVQKKITTKKTYDCSPSPFGKPKAKTTKTTKTKSRFEPKSSWIPAGRCGFGNPGGPIQPPIRI